jgi:hypothetical protein
MNLENAVAKHRLLPQDLVDLPNAPKNSKELFRNSPFRVRCFARDVAGPPVALLISVNRFSRWDRKDRCRRAPRNSRAPQSASRPPLMARSGNPIGTSIAMSDDAGTSATSSVKLSNIATSAPSKVPGSTVTAIHPALQPSTPIICVGLITVLIIARLEGEGLVSCRYCDARGRRNVKANPNGSLGSIRKIYACSLNAASRESHRSVGWREPTACSRARPIDSLPPRNMVYFPISI